MNAIINPFPVHNLLARRSSSRAYNSRPLDKQSILSLLEAARWAPSSYNRQPWRFVVWERHSNPDAFQRAFETLASSNQKWVAHVPVLIGVFADTDDGNGKPNSSAIYDTGAAAFSLVLQAHSLGLSACQIGGFDADALGRAFSVPENVRALAIIAVGFPTDARLLGSELQARESKPRVRRPISEFTFHSAWSVPFI